MTSFSPKVRLCGTIGEVSEVAKTEILDILRSSAASSKDGFASLALSGGSTPKILYSSLQENKDDLQKVKFFLGDERLVPLDGEDSNYHMAFECLLKDLPQQNLFPVVLGEGKAAISDPSSGETEAREVAEAYEKILLSQLPTEVDAQSGTYVPIFDVVLLGFGSDGHTASIFPGSVAEHDGANVVSVSFPSITMKPKVWRVTLTRHVIQHAKHVYVLACGKDKEWVVQGVLQDSTEGQIPVARFLRGCKGSVTFIVDADAYGSSSVSNDEGKL